MQVIRVGHRFPQIPMDAFVREIDGSGNFFAHACCHLSWTGYRMGRTFRMGACALAWTMAAAPVLAAPQCAKDSEVTAIQAASIQQQLMVAALTCNAVAN